MHEPDQQFYLFLINADTPSDREINSWHPNLIIERVWWQYDPVNWRATMSSARSIPLEKVLKEYREETIYLDSDIIIRGPLVEIFSSLKEYDLTVKFRPQLNQRGPAGTDYAAKFNAGVIGIRPSPIGLKFTRRYNQLIQNHISSGKPLVYYLEEEKINSWIDQELLFVTYLEYQKELLFKSLPEKYNDAKFHNESIIWHGKGTAYKHPMFTTERMRYDYPVLYHPLGTFNQILSLSRNIKRCMNRANHSP
jgi:hypothetical protein